MSDHQNFQPTLSVVIPVYNSAPILPDLAHRIHSVLNQCKLPNGFECILVNDGSHDNCWEVLQNLASRYPFIRGFNLRRNFGQHNAIMAGLHQAKGDIVILMDDDLQHPPEGIPLMLDAIQTGYDVCYTNYLHRRHVWWKKLGSGLNDRIATRLLGKPPGLYLSSFKAIRRPVVNEIIRYDGPYPYIDGLILDVTRSITSIDIEHADRAAGIGNYNLRRSIALCMGMITSFSIAPLRVVSIAGFSLAFTSLLALAFVVLRKLSVPNWPAGWASLLATILFLGGVQLLGIGVIGEYLGRIYLKLNHKPQFVIADQTPES